MVAVADDGLRNGPKEGAGIVTRPVPRLAPMIVDHAPQGSANRLLEQRPKQRAARDPKRLLATLGCRREANRHG
jgi:hypothetical protein